MKLLLNSGFAVLFVANILFCQNGILYLRISVPTTAELIVTNPWNKKTGCDPRGQRTWYSEIPEANYGPESYSEDMPGRNIFDYNLVSPQDDGKYEINIIGNALGEIDLNVSGKPDETAQSISFKLKTFIHQNEEQKYTLTYSGNPATTSTLQKKPKTLQNNTLASDIKNAGRLHLIGNGNFLKQCIAKAQQLTKALHDNDLIKAKLYFTTIDSVITEAYRSPSTTKTIGDFAYTVLREDLDLLYQILYAPVQQNIAKP